MRSDSGRGGPVARVEPCAGLLVHRRVLGDDTNSVPSCVMAAIVSGPVEDWYGDVEISALRRHTGPVVIVGVG